MLTLYDHGPGYAVQYYVTNHAQTYEWAWGYVLTCAQIEWCIKEGWL